MSILDELEQYTFWIQHSPNCKKRYLVRLCGKGKAVIDGLPDGETSDLLGYGDTLEEAANEAVLGKNKRDIEKSGEPASIRDKSKWILSALLSSFPPGTVFYSKYSTGYLDNFLDRQISTLLSICRLQIVRDTFTFHYKYKAPCCEWLHAIFEPDCRFKEEFGLVCCGPENDIVITVNINDAIIEAKKNLSKHQFDILSHLGRKLKTGR